MSPDPSVLTALLAAVDNDPENTPLRLHLTDLLLAAARPADALTHCARILARDPANKDALDRLARANAALTGTASSSTPPPPPKTDRSPFPELDEPRDWGDADDNRVAVGRARGGPAEDDRGLYEVEKPTIRLSDVAGMDEVKLRLNRAFLGPMKNPEMMKLYGKSLRGGLLLYGPPGCGKTFIARATAGELAARFLSVGLSDVLDMYLGQSERNLHAIFEEARRNKPCVLFFDELDALGRKRSLVRHSAGHDVVNQLLAEMDSVGNDNDGVFILAATNHPWDVDTALRRPGRLDRTLLVLPPDRPAREGIVRFHLGTRPADGIDPAALASKTDGYSGADLAHLVESAAELAMEESLSAGRVRPIRMADFQRAMKETKASTRPWFETAKNYALFANDGGVYDDLLAYLRAQKML